MNPNTLTPYPDANSSSLAHLNHLPPGTNPEETPDPNPAPPPPQLHNRARPLRAPLNPEQDLMDVDTGTDTSRSSHDTSPDHAPGRGLKRARPDTDDAEALEHSEPIYKQRRTGSPEPVASAMDLSPEALQNALLDAVTHGNLYRLQSLVNQTENFKNIFDGKLWKVAVKNGHVAVIDWLSKQVDRLDLPKPQYNRLFEIAVGHGQMDVLQWLAGQLLVIEGVTYDSDDALTLAALGGHLEVVKHLVEHGCNIQHRTSFGENALIFAAKSGHLEVVKYLAEQGCDIHQVNNHGENALIFAAHGGHLEVVKYLVEHGCDIQQVGLYGNALSLAKEAGHLEVVKYLVEHGRNIHQVGIYDHDILTLLAQVGNLKVVKHLVEQGCNIQQVNNDGSNALIHAANRGHLDVVKYLAEQGCNIQHVDNYGDNALTLAANRGHLDVVKYLVEHGCDIQQVSNDGDNALIRAAKAGHLEIVKLLVGQECDIHQVNDDGDNALIRAARAGHLEVVKYLAGQGCNIHQVNNDGDHALIRAARAGHLEIVKFLVEHGCNIHQVNNDGDHALILAAQAHDLGTVQYLVEKGLNINQVNSSGDTALARSMEFKCIDIACDLIRRGASLTIGRPPHRDGYLFRALKIGNTELIKLLIPRCDVSKRSSSGITPLMLAARENLIEVAIPLIQATLQVPNGKALVHEAWQIKTDPLFQELLNNPFIIDEAPSSYSRLSHEGKPVIVTSVVHHYFYTQRAVLQRLQNQLGSNQSMTPMQQKSAQVGILAELPAWKLTNAVEKIFMRELTASLLPIQKRVATFISEDIEVLATQANGWEDTHLVPVIEHLYPSCLMHSLSAHPASGIIKELTDKGLYHPIARRIASAWTSAWVAMSEEATPLLRPMPAAQIEDWDSEDLADLDPITGDVVIRPGTLARNIDSFVGTPVGLRLLQTFCAALKDEFDAVESRILHTDDVNLPPESKNLYADLMMRQLHLIAQFWRAESS